MITIKPVNKVMMKAKEDSNDADVEHRLHLLGAYHPCLFLALLFIFNLISTSTHEV